ncbi:MAG: hypothetical protein HZC24_10010 [Rhodocyclales bacterium]|nr:hypothetical protein [Rhodocyclales bacterium]
MEKSLARLGLSLLLLAGGCAAPQPVPFQLVDAASKVYRGTLFPDGQRVEVIIDGQVFSGFYIVASGAAVSQTPAGRRPFPRDTVTTFSSNSARAQLKAGDGRRLGCEFLFESRRALGECRTPGGAVFQLIADGS